MWSDWLIYLPGLILAPIIYMVLGNKFFLPREAKVFNYLKENGESLFLQPTKILETNKEYRKNYYRNFYRLYFTWKNPEDNFEYGFVSKELDYDPTIFIKEKTYEIIIDKNDPNLYWVDISDLLKFKKGFRYV